MVMFTTRVYQNHYSTCVSRSQAVLTADAESSYVCKRLGMHHLSLAGSGRHTRWYSLCWWAQHRVNRLHLTFNLTKRKGSQC